MKLVELMNDIFIETDTIKMNHFITNFLTGKKYDKKQLEDAIHLLDSSLTNSINIDELSNDNIPFAICRILYTAGLWRSLCDFYFIILVLPFTSNFEFLRTFKEEDETQLIARYAYLGTCIRMTIDDNSPAIRILQTDIEEVRF